MASRLFQNYFLAVDCHTCRLISWSLYKSPVISIKCTLMTFHFFFIWGRGRQKAVYRIQITGLNFCGLSVEIGLDLLNQFCKHHSSSLMLISFQGWFFIQLLTSFFQLHNFCWSNSLSFRYYSSSCMCVFFDHLYMWPFRSVVVDIRSIVPKIPSFVPVTSSNSCAYYAISFIRDFFDQLCLIFHNWVVFFGCY